MDIQIKVPVKPYIRNYLLSIYQEQPLVLDRTYNCIILDKLYDLLTRPARRAGKRWQNMKSAQDYTQTIAVNLKSWPASKTGVHVSEEKVYHFNQFVDKLIKDRLFTQLDVLFSLMGFETYPDEVHRCDLPIDIKAHILSYMEYHNLEEGGMKWSSLYKAYQRFRNERNEKQGGTLSVPLFHVPHIPEFAAGRQSA